MAEVSALGQPVSIPRGKGHTVPGYVIAGRLLHWPGGGWECEAPTTAVAVRARSDVRWIKVLAQADAAEALEAGIHAALHSCAKVGQSRWASRVLKPGRDIGMDGDHVQSCVIHTITAHGTVGDGSWGRLTQEIKAAATRADRSALAHAWQQDDWKDAVLLRIPGGALPAAVEAIREQTAALGCRAMIGGGGLLVSNLAPAGVEAFLETSGIGRWVRGTQVPLRLAGDTCLHSPEGPFWPVRIAMAAAGHEAQALIRGACATGHMDVARAVTASIEHAVTTTAVHAYDPATDNYEDMVLVRAPGRLAAAFRRLIYHERTIRVRDQVLDVLPYTHLADARHGIAPPSRQAADIHERACHTRDNGPGRRSTVAIVAQRTPMDGKGEPLEDKTATVQLGRGAERTWPGAPLANPVACSQRMEAPTRRCAYGCGARTTTRDFQAPGPLPWAPTRPRRRSPGHGRLLVG